MYLAAHVKTNPDGELNNSMDDAVIPMTIRPSSFADQRFNEIAVRDEYGLTPANDDDYACQDGQNGFFSPREDREANSDNDHYVKEVKRSNLLQLFLHGIQVDKYIMAN